MSNLRGSDITKYIAVADQVHPHVDYLRFSFSIKIPFYENILDTIDDDNSCDFHDIHNGFTYSRVRLDIGDALLVSVAYEGVIVRLFMYCRYSNYFALKGGQYSKVDFYGAYFRMVEIGFISSSLLDEVVGYSEDGDGNPVFPMITRIDYAVDLFFTKTSEFPSPTKIFPTLHQLSQIQKYETLGLGVTSRSIGSKSYKRYFVRMYDKLLDICKKEKSVYYADYVGWSSIHRYEVQFGPHFCKTYGYQTYDKLLEKCRSFFGETCFDGVLFYSYDATKDFQSLAYRTNYFKQFGGRGEKILKAGYNPYIVLMTELDIRDNKTNRKAIEGYISRLKSDIRYKDLFIL